MLLNITSNSSKPIDINNGTVLLDRQRRFSFEAEENSVALISLQYDSGECATCNHGSRLIKKNVQSVNIVRDIRGLIRMFWLWIAPHQDSLF